MNKLIVSILAASLAACASQSSTRKPAATADTEPERRAERAQRAERMERVDTDTKQRDVRPVAVAPVDRAAVDARDRDRDGVRDSREVGDTRDVRDARDPRDVRDTRADNALEQGNNASDLENARKVRGAVSDDKSLSFAAKNAQIISNQGEITLRGTVKNAQEKSAIEKYARQVVGTAHVHNELTTEQ